MRGPKPFWNSQKKCFYVQIGKKQHRLAKDEDEAWRLYHKLMAHTPRVAENGFYPTVNMMVDALLDWTGEHRAERTKKTYAEHLVPFQLEFGDRQPGTIKSEEIEAWMKGRYARSGSNRILGAVRTLSRLYNWAKKRNRVECNPILAISRPQYEPRFGYVTPEQWEKAVKNASPDLLDFMTVMKRTGARPYELRMCRRSWYDRKGKILDLTQLTKKHKRIIHLDDVCISIVESRVTDPVFAKKGRPWTTDSLLKAVNKACDFHVYTLRHTFATDAIIAGVDLVTIAKLMGHRDLTMLNMVYAQLDARSDHLKSALDKINPPDTDSSSSGPDSNVP